MVIPAGRKRIPVFILVVSLAIVGFTGWMIWRAYARALEQVYLKTDSLAQALDHHAARTLGAVGNALAVVRAEIEQTGMRAADPERVRHMLRQRIEETPQIRSIVLLDERGVAVHDSDAIPPRPLDASDRAYFTAHRDSPKVGLHIGPPIRSRINGAWTIILSRRIDKPDGSFGGIVSASLDLGYFQTFYRNIRLGAHGSVVLLTDAGRLIVREPFDPEAVGQDYRGAAPFLDGFPGATSGPFTVTSPIDAAARLFSYRKLDRFPLVVLVTVARDEALAEWRADSLQAGGMALVLVLLAIAMATGVLREMRKREAAELLTHSALRRLERQHTVLDTILKTLPDGVQLLDAEARLVGWNDRFFEIMGLDRDAILRTPDPAGAIRRALAARGEYGPGDPEELAVRREQIARGGKPLHFRRQQATGRWVECRGTPVPGQGYLGVFRDVTEEVARVDALHDANARLERQAAELAASAEKLDAARRRAEQALLEAEHANRAKSSFLAHMSHELRTPLNAINGFSEIIAERHFGPAAMDRYADYARDIHSSGQHLLGVINSILDIAKIEAGKMDLREEAVDLGGCLQAALRMVEPLAGAKSVRLLFQPPPEPMRLRADEQKLIQSILNILSNAVKFTPGGGTVSLSARRLNAEVAVTVRDTGIGIRPEDQWRVFAPFSQIDSTLARSSKGTGLGMSLTKSLIELHGGRIALESAVDAGTTVTVYLPIRRFEFAPLRAVT